MQTITTLPRLGRGNWGAARRQQFELEMEPVIQWMGDYILKIGFAPVARSWLYAFESVGLIGKGDFDAYGNWMTKCRKWIKSDGTGALIPWHFVGADESRRMTGWDQFDDECTAREYMNRRLRDCLASVGQYSPASYWKHQRFYPILWTEKRDLIKLFEKELPGAVKRFAGKGQTNIGSRVDVIEECMAAEQLGLLPVILYCGDHDPSGIKISDGIQENLRFAAQGLGWEDELDWMAADGRIVRFGLNAEFIDNAGLLWIDGLETGRDESKGCNDLADPRHPQHGAEYVQSYLAEFGPKKCEANALIANPTAARALIRDELWQWLSHEGHKQWLEENRSARSECKLYADGVKRMLAMFDSVGALYNPRRLEQAMNNGLPSLPPSSD